MLQSLSIKNYALIDDIKVDLEAGLTMITGQTGAGKSIILGALGLLLGSRAQLDAARDRSKKCVIEGHFNIGSYRLGSFFEREDLDFDEHTIIRRELLPSGKSRAFVNDTPVTLTVLSALGAVLIDVHSQHQTLNLGQADFSFYILDALAQTRDELRIYQEKRTHWLATKKQLDQLMDGQAAALKELDYNSFLLNELLEVNLPEVDEQALDQELATLSNVEQLEQGLGESYGLLNDPDTGVSDKLRLLNQKLGPLASVSPAFEALVQRAQSIQIEIDDIQQEVYDALEKLERDPERLQVVEQLSQKLYDLKRKHAVTELSELVRIKDTLSQKVQLATDNDAVIQEAEQALEKATTALEEAAQVLNTNRQAKIPMIQQGIEAVLRQLEMPDARFAFALTPSQEYGAFGKVQLEVLFSANLGIDPAPLKRAASGGELSRVMLAIKSLLAKNISLPTLIFDEIDTGVSGSIANKMGDLMQQMGRSMQVICITHLPQVAAKGDVQYKVYKEVQDERTVTMISRLNQEERIAEIAQMLGGQKLSESAINHAKELLN